MENEGMKKNHGIAELCEFLNEMNIKGQENWEEFEHLHFSYSYGAVNRVEIVKLSKKELKKKRQEKRNH